MLFQKGCIKEYMIEFHMDDDPYFQETVKENPLQGYISIPKNPFAPARIFFVHDESIFLPHALKAFYWTLDGHMSQRNKTEGQGTMMSLLMSREFRFDFNLSEEQKFEVLKVANCKRKCEENTNKKQH